MSDQNNENSGGLRKLFDVKNMDPKKRKKAASYIKILGGFYLIYMAYLTFKGYDEIPENLRWLIIACLVFFIAVGIFFLIQGVLSLTKDARVRMAQQKEEERLAAIEREKERKLAEAEGRPMKNSVKALASFQNPADDDEEESEEPAPSSAEQEE